MSSCKHSEIFQRLLQMTQWWSEMLWDKNEDPISSLSKSPRAVGAETTALEKLYRYAEHCILSVFTEKSRRLLQDYVNLCYRAAPCVDQVSHGSAGCFLYTRAMENQLWLQLSPLREQPGWSELNSLKQLSPKKLFQRESKGAEVKKELVRLNLRLLLWKHWFGK